MEIVSNEKDVAVFNCLYKGRYLANSRLWISSHTHMTDREVRKSIERLRQNGILICNEQNGDGYYIAETDQEVYAQYSQDYRRAMAILKRIKPFRDRLITTDEQITLDEVVDWGKL